MRCSCKVCGPEVWMVQAESAALGCVCPECGYRCADCLGTDTVVPRDRVAALAADGYNMDNCRRIIATREDAARRLREMGFAVVPSSANFRELNIGVRMRLSRNMVAKLPKPT